MCTLCKYLLSQRKVLFDDSYDTLHSLVSAHFDMNWQHEVGVVWSEL